MKNAREVAVRFEQMRAVFAKLMNKANVNIPVPLQIVAFRNSKELRQVAPLWHGKPTEVAGLFQGGQDRSFIMLDTSVEDPWTVVFHEYAHQLMNGVLNADVDPWFEEGFAVYFSSIQVDGKQAYVGKVPDVEYQTMRQGAIKISDLLRVQHNSATYNESGDHRSVFYAESGMFVHYIYDRNMLLNVATYLDLKMNKGLSVEDSFQQAFGMGTAQFDKVFRSYLASGEYKYFKLPTPTDIIEKGYSVKPLGPYDNATVIADIHLHSLDYREKAASEFEAVLKSDPNNAAACRGLGYAYLEKRDFTQAREFFKRAAQGDSKDARVHYYSALLMNMEPPDEVDPAEMTRELESAIALDPSFADAYMLMGYAASRQGDMTKAIANMQKAVVLNPRNENYRFNLAEIYMANRQMDEGLTILQALSKSSDPFVAQRAAQSLQQGERVKSAMQGEEISGVPEIQNRGPVVVRPLQVRNGASGGSPETQAEMQDTVAKTEKTVVVPAAAPIRFAKGTVRSVDCSAPPTAMLTVDVAGTTLLVKVSDTKHVLVLGADGFSCDWQKQKVAINYRFGGEGPGTAVSIEVQ